MTNDEMLETDESARQSASDGLVALLTELEENLDGDAVTVGQLLNATDNRSYGPLMVLIGAIAISPLGAVPGMSLVTGSLMLLLAGQMLVGQQHLWLPGRLLSIEVARERVSKAAAKCRPWVTRLQRALQPRLKFLCEEPAIRVIAGLAIVLALSFFPLALVPMGVFVPGLAIVLLGLGVTARDGIFVIAGYAAGTVAISTLVAATWAT